MYNIDKKRLVETFTDLAAIPSPSWKEKEIIQYLIKFFRDHKIPVKKYKCNNSYNLVAVIKGNPNRTPILFSAHMDTVVPCENVKPVVTDTKITSDGTTILGSDDKSAIAIFLEGIRHLKENSLDHGNIEILLSCAEEVGLEGIKLFDLSNVNAKYAFVFDSDGKVGQIVTQAPFHVRYDLDITGKAAHAGMEPEKGKNAIVVISEIIASLPNGRLDDETTLNVGTIRGGAATNIVAENVKSSFELRSISRQKLKKYETSIKETIKTITLKHKVKYKINRTLLYSGFSLGPNDKLVQLTTDAMKKIKLAPQYKASGGGSDTNIINAAGIKAVNLSCGMQKVHTTSEYILIRDLINGTKLMLSIIESV